LIPIFVTIKKDRMEIKQEIAQIVDQLPNEVLVELLGYLRQLEESSNDKARRSLHLHSILTEDKEVLDRLSK
jgi:hypothetical protein